jgi:group I intron endonuclease
MVIYKVTNKINNKCYIGQTIQKDPYARWAKHKYDAKKGLNYPLYNAIQKYGKLNFEFEIIHIVNSLDELNQLEVKYIKEFNSLTPNGYNIKDGGNNRSPSLETRQKISKTLSGRIGCTKGRSSPLKGRKQSPELIEKRSNAIKKPVLWINMNIIFNSTSDAAIYLNCSHKTIQRCCLGKIKSFKHHTFEYLNLESEN